MKKFLAMVISALMLVALVPTAMAENSATVIMNEPTLLSNFNSMKVGSAISTSKVTGLWGAYSNATSAATFQKEDSGNVYLEITDKEITGVTNATTGIYGAFFQMNDTAVTGENVAVEMKVKIPASEKNKRIELRLRGDYQSGNPLTEHPESNTYNSGVYIVGSLTASDNGYIYRDYYTTGETKNTVKLTEYDEQWISLKWLVNTTTDTCTIYCNGNEKAVINDARFYPKGNMDAILSNIKYVQICIPNGTNIYNDEGKLVKKEADGGEIWVDDVVFCEDVSNGDALSAEIPSFMSVEDEALSKALVNVDLIKADGTAYGNQFGLIIAPPDTSMVGNYTVPVENVSGATTQWIVQRTYDREEFDFDGTGESAYVPKNANGFNSVVSLFGSNALKLGNEGVGSTRNYEDISISVPESDNLVEWTYDIYWDTPGTSTTFYNRLYCGGTSDANFALDITYRMETTNLFTIKCDDTQIFASKLEKNKPLNVKYIIDKQKETIAFYFDGVYQCEFNALKHVENLKKELKTLRFYTIPSSKAGAEEAIIYIDNITAKACAKISSIDTTVNIPPTTVVRGRVPALTKTVPTVLTDGSADVLPIKWDAVNTSVLGEVTVNGTVQGFGTEPVTATVTVVEYPYEAVLENGKITVAQTTDYNPGGTLYVVNYTAEGAMVSVTTYSVEGAAEFDAAGENVKAFIFAETLKPLSSVIE